MAWRHAYGNHRLPGQCTPRPAGSFVVPAPIRKALGFQPGDSLVVRIDDERLVVEKTDAVERRLRAYFKKFKGRSLADELIAERREEARRQAP